MGRRRTDPPTPTVWRVGKYIRLSREDGNEVSESVVNQDKMLNQEIPSLFRGEVYQVVDTYVDDGTSGTTDLERRDFQRMVADVKAGRINCIVVKNLSRAFRNSANQGRFLEEFIPLYRVRFLSLYQPRIDTFLDPEVVHSLEVGITGFLNEQYAYKTSVDVRRTFRAKREKGEFIGAFAPYGYRKDPQNKNALLVDEEAAAVVRRMFSWFVDEGMSKAGIARRLNDLAIPNPTAYKRAAGYRYENPHAAANDGLWNPTTVARMLRDPLYVGVLRQGRQKVVSYKVHQRTAVPESQWFTVEDAVPAIVSRELFEAAQRLHGQDTRTAPGGDTVYLFSGLVRCADCRKGMTRRSAGRYVYYACRTYLDKSRTRCGRHTIRLDVLEQAVLEALRREVARMPDRDALLEALRKAPAAPAEGENREGLLARRRKELARTETLLDGLYLDWKGGEVDEARYRRLRERLEERAQRQRAALDRLAAEDPEPAPDGEWAEFLRCGQIQSLSRGLLAALVDGVYVHDDGAIDVVFRFSEPQKTGGAFV